MSAVFLAPPQPGLFVMRRLRLAAEQALTVAAAVGGIHQSITRSRRLMDRHHTPRRRTIPAPRTRERRCG